MAHFTKDQVSLIKNDPRAVLAKLRTRQHLRERGLLTEGGKPETGPYYWVPLPAGKKIVWDLSCFYDADLPQDETTHPYVWKYVLETLAAKWRKPGLRSRLSDAYYSIPRGRVNRNSKGGYIIYHGGDAPAGHSLIEVRNAYRVPRGGFNGEQLDDHERPQASDVASLEMALGLKRGVLGVKNFGGNPFDDL